MASARLHFLDALGVGIAASTVAENRALAHEVANGTASLLGGGSAEAGAAAMINGALIHALEFDDTHIGSVFMAVPSRRRWHLPWHSNALRAGKIC